MYHDVAAAAGAAPVFDPCGRAGGGPAPTGGHGEYVNTTFAKFGDLGSLLPYSHAAVWRASSVVETIWNVRANHGGGYQCRPRRSRTRSHTLSKPLSTSIDFVLHRSPPLSPSRPLPPLSSHSTSQAITMGPAPRYRLCPLQSELTEACFQATPMEFARNSRLMMSDGKMLELNSTFVSEGTLPAGSTWQITPRLRCAPCR